MPVMMVMQMKAYFRDSKWKIFMLATQMQIPIELYRIQLSTKKAAESVPTVATKLRA